MSLLNRNSKEANTYVYLLKKVKLLFKSVSAVIEKFVWEVTNLNQI